MYMSKGMVVVNICSTLHIYDTTTIIVKDLVQFGQVVLKGDPKLCFLKTQHKSSISPYIDYVGTQSADLSDMTLWCVLWKTDQ